MDLCYFEDAEPGYQAYGRSYRVSAEEIVEFASKWDPMPYHINERDAAETDFGGLVASSAHIYALFVRLAHKQERHMAVIAALGVNDMNFIRPVRPGDELYLAGVCLNARESESKSDRGVCEFEWKLINHREEIVLTLKQTLMLAKRRVVYGA